MQKRRYVFELSLSVVRRNARSWRMLDDKNRIANLIRAGALDVALPAPALVEATAEATERSEFH